MKKNVKQILTLERERVSGGDGFLSAAQTAAKARGEVLEVGTKKKKLKTEFSRRGLNLKGRASRFGSVIGTASGAATPMTEDLDSGQSTPMQGEGEDEEDGTGEGAENGVDMSGLPRKEVITCESALGCLWFQDDEMSEADMILGRRSHPNGSAESVTG